MYLLVVVLLLFLTAELISRACLIRKLKWDITASSALAEPDEEVEFTITLSNSSARVRGCIRQSVFFPLAYTDKCGKGVQSFTLSYSEREHIDGYSYAENLFVWPRRFVRSKHSLKYKSRGVKPFKGAYIGESDFLGLKVKTGFFAQPMEIVVMPRRFEGLKLERLLGGYLGDYSVNRFIFEDPMLSVGFSPYTGNEPQKNVAWLKSSASEEILVKRFDHTRELCCSVLMNADVCEECEGERLLEKTLSITRSVVELLSNSNTRFGFATNAEVIGTSYLWPTGGDGQSKDGVLSILEGLGRVTMRHVQPFSSHIGAAVRACEQGRAFVIITPRISDKWMEGVHRLGIVTGVKPLVIEAAGLEETT
ncbi:MAG TPA: hypothetical protein PLM48_07000 [Clostridia bacterium]|nr:hypothetical protein [Clostridia bacterium]